MSTLAARRAALVGEYALLVRELLALSNQEEQFDILRELVDHTGTWTLSTGRAVLLRKIEAARERRRLAHAAWRKTADGEATE
jgi:hypothetical protein